MPEAAFGISSDYFFDTAAVKTAIDDVDRRALGHAGGYIRRTARSSIKKKGSARYEDWPKARKRGVAFRRWKNEQRYKPHAPPGHPPYTHTGILREAILYAFDPVARDVIVGPAATKADQVGGLHEHGGVRFGDVYPPRPFMAPALQKAAPKIPEFWANALRA